jgi:U3 small nucleolar RNA-associated protein 11
VAPFLHQVLRNKAALRNPDEFYFAMERSRTREGVHVAGCDLSRHFMVDSGC